jgi:hypothetical protein
MDKKRFNRATNFAIAGWALFAVPCLWVFISPFFNSEKIDNFVAIIGIVGFSLIVAAAWHAP